MDTLKEPEDAIRDALAKWKPAKVLLYRGEDLYREIDVPPKGKRWAAIVPLIMKLEWSRIELRSRTGAVLDVIEEAADEPAAPVLDEEPGRSTREERQLALVLKAQDQALKHRSAETQMALTAAANIIDKVAGLIGGLAELFQYQLSQVKAPRAEAAEKKDDLQEAMQLAQTILPLLSAGDKPATGANNHPPGKKD